MNVLLSAGTSIARTLSLIRDTEIENTIRDYITPVLLSAKLEPSSIKFYIIKDPTLNAFVAGGQKIFINSGLITKSESLGEIIGVLAHEIGHIAGGHLSRTHDALSRSSIPTILSSILGGVATIATDRGDLGGAIATIGGSISRRSFLRYSRGQENAADHAALKYMEETGISARGLLNFISKVATQETMSGFPKDPYVRTHPLSLDRINTIKNHLRISKYPNSTFTNVQIMSYSRIKEKLTAFLTPPKSTLLKLSKGNISPGANYARAIAYKKKR